ncbi:unnamed protein product, partial [Meganyctiphanes norvegica]
SLLTQIKHGTLAHASGFHDKLPMLESENIDSVSSASLIQQLLDTLNELGIRHVVIFSDQTGTKTTELLCMLHKNIITTEMMIDNTKNGGRDHVNTSFPDFKNM